MKRRSTAKGRIRGEDATFPDGLPDWAVRFLGRLAPRKRAVLSAILDMDPELPARKKSASLAASLGMKAAAIRQARKWIRDRALREFPPEILERVDKVFAGQTWIKRRLGATPAQRKTPAQHEAFERPKNRVDPDVATAADCEAGIAQIDEEIAALRSEHRPAFARKDWKRVREINLRINRLRRGRKNLVVTLDYLRHPDRLKARGSLFTGRDPYTRKAIR